MTKRSAEEQAIRAKFGEAHRSFWQSTNRAPAIERLVDADAREQPTEVKEAWGKLLGGHGGVVTAFPIAQVLGYLQTLHTLRQQHQVVFDKELFMGVNDENVFSRLFGAIMPYILINEPLSVPDELDIGFLMIRGTSFQNEVRFGRVLMPGGMHAQSAKFAGGLVLRGAKISNAGLNLNSVNELRRLVIHNCLLSKLNLGSATCDEIAISDTVVEELAEFKSMTAHTFFITNTTFRGDAQFQKSNLSGRTNISAKFARFPEFFDSKLSEETRIEDIEYDPKQAKSALPKEAERIVLEGDLLAIRHLRIQAQQKRWLREEIKFFAEEQRVERRLLRHPSKTTEFVISWFYDKASGYGSSVTTAARSFFLFNALACLFYQFLLGLGTMDLPAPLSAHYIGLLPDAIQVENGSFSNFRGALLGLQNVFNPLALFTAKSLVTVHSPWALFLSLMQTITSLALLALFILAMKTRFQRSSGGSAM